MTYFYFLIYQLFYPVLFVFIQNIDEVIIDDLLLPFYIFIVIGTALFFLLKLLKWNLKILSYLSLGIFLFFSYGHFFNLFRDFKLGGLVIGTNTTLLIFSLIIFIVVFYLINKNILKPKAFLRFFIILYLIQSIFLITDSGRYLFSRNKSGEEINKLQSSQSDLPSAVITQNQNLPDIYYIVLDEYGRQDVLKSYLNFDNSTFEKSLNDRGFTVLSDNHSNYIETFLSLSSSLNFEYINYLTEIVGVENKDRNAPYAMISNNRAAQFLKNQGYLYVDFSNGWGPLRSGNKYADIDIVTGKRTEFSRILISTTALEPFVSPLIKNDARETILSTFSKLQEIPKIEKPTFTFVHFLLPHGPYLFDKDGSPINIHSDYIKFDKDFYLGQLLFANKKTLETVDVLLKDSLQEPIIIVASDHGPESLGIFQTEFADLTKNQLDERFGNFIAVYLPEGEAKEIDKLKSPVNLFRVIFNNYFEADYPLLEDKKFYASYEKPYLFIEVNEQTGK